MNDKDQNKLALEDRLHFIGLSHKSSSIDVREKFALINENSSRVCQLLAERFGGAFILSTCNRTEFYISSKEPGLSRKTLIGFLAQELSCPLSLAEEHLVSATGLKALAQLFRVAAGLESMILGEGQILNQLKRSYEQCLPYCDALLNQAVQRALAAGKKVRTHTTISRGAVSVAAAAIQTIQRLLEPKEIAEQQIMIIGSGEIAKLTLDLLHSQGAAARLSMVTRQKPSFLELRDYRGIHNISYVQFKEFLPQQDIIFACTSAPHYLIGRADLGRTESSKALCLCDLSLPRNIDPALSEDPGITLFNLDQLNEEVESSKIARAGQMGAAGSLVSSELERFYSWYNYPLAAQMTLDNSYTTG